MSETKNNEHGESMDVVDNPGKYTFQRIKEAQDYLRGYDDALASIKNPEITNWLDAKQKYLEFLINNYDSGYLALFEWLEKNYGLPAGPNDPLHKICRTKHESPASDLEREELHNRVEGFYRHGFINDRERDFTHRVIEFGWDICMSAEQSMNGNKLVISFGNINKQI